jgi:methylenetetrahydrofolate--tRNA-(uracil-5-)-methyltransferase
VESAASGLLAGRNAAALALDEAPSSPPRTTAIGALAWYASHADPRHYQPTNITFGIMEPPPAAPGGRRQGRLARRTAQAERALAALDEWRGALVRQ